MYTFDVDTSSEVAASHNGHAAPTAPRRVAGPLSDDLLATMQRYWQAANYLTIGQIYVQANPLLREPLRPVSTPVRFDPAIANLA